MRVTYEAISGSYLYHQHSMGREFIQLEAGSQGQAVHVVLAVVIGAIFLVVTFLILWAIASAAFVAFSIVGPIIGVGGIIALITGLATGESGTTYGGLICTGIGLVWLVIFRFMQ